MKSTPFLGLTKRKRRHHHKPSLGTVVDVNACRACGGAVVRCSTCRHYHCDDDCRPIACARRDDEPLASVGLWREVPDGGEVVD